MAAELGAPVVLRADLPAPAPEACEIDAVLLGLEGASAIRSAWRELQHGVRPAGRVSSGAIIQPWCQARPACWSGRRRFRFWAWHWQSASADGKHAWAKPLRSGWRSKPTRGGHRAD